jgi:hypothetical protein
MSNVITIKELLDLNEKWFVGQIIEHLEATIDIILKPREVKGQKGTFWSQFIVIKDNTAKIGLNFTIDSEEETIPTSAKGTEILVEGAKGTIYQDKNGETQRKLSGGKVKLLRQNPSEKVKSDKEEREYWDHRKDKEQRIIAKSALAKSLIEAGREWNKTTQKEADSWFDWIMNGIEGKKEEPKTDEESPERAALRKTWHILKEKLIQTDFWNDEDEIGGEAVENKYRNWLDKEFEVPSSSYLTDEEMEEGIRMMNKWWNKSNKKGEKDGLDASEEKKGS